MIDKLDLKIEMASLSLQQTLSSDLSRCVNSADSTAGRETPATPRHVELDQAEPEPGEGRFIVIATTAEAFELWLFDKQQQSEEMHKVTVPFGLGAIHAIAAQVMAWQLQGINLEEIP